MLTGALHAGRVWFSCSNGLEVVQLTVVWETMQHAQSYVHTGKANVYSRGGGVLGNRRSSLKPPLEPNLKRGGVLGGGGG